MSVECFVDTNVLLYAVSSHPAEVDKARRARRILSQQDFGLSTQVLQEFFVNATQKIARPLSEEQALELIDIVSSSAPVLAVDVDLVVEAIAHKKRFAVSYWDAAIIAAAHTLGAAVLYTEDLGHGVTYGQVRAMNPFV